LGASSEPFTADEVGLILEEAVGLGSDPLYLVSFLLHFGIHPCLVAYLSSDDIQKRRVDGKDVYSLNWARAKTGAEVEFPVLESDMAWLPEWLDRAPYGSRWSIDRQLTRIEERLQKRGYSVNVCARRFRHTCCVLLLQRGVPEVVIRKLLQVTPQTLETYGKYRFETVYQLVQTVAWVAPRDPSTVS
jgi:integrase